MSSDFELGTWLGRRQALSTCAARANTSDVACLKHIRDNKLYKAKTSTWAQFCSTYLGASKTQVDLLIRYYEEFGPTFYLLNQLTRVSPAEYRAMDPHITPDGIVLDGKLIPFDEENVREISVAVDTLRRALPAPASPRKKLPPDLLTALGGIGSALDRLQSHYRPITIPERTAIIELLNRFVEIAARQGIYVTR